MEYDYKLQLVRNMQEVGLTLQEPVTEYELMEVA
jgi:hypothetical protein